MNAELILRSDAVSNANATLHTILDCMSDWYWEIDASGCYTYCSSQVETCLGYTPEELLGTRPCAYMPLEEAERIMPLFADAVQMQKRIQGLENWKMSKDNKMILLSTNGVPFYDEDGNLAGYRGVDSNITDRHNYEKRLEAAKEAAEAANRAKSEFLANMSHELRTPLNGIIGMAELLKMSSLSDEQQRFVTALDTCSTDLLALIDDVLDLSKIEAEQLELEIAEFSLVRALSGVLDTQKSLAHKKGLQLKLEIDDTIPSVLLGDELRLKQVLLNLVSNAIKFTSQGEITIKVTIVEQYDDRLRLQLEVRDTGVGIAANALEKIFKPFVQEDSTITRKFGGTGLGLTISQRLARLMGGDITVTSSVGLGSSFKFSLLLDVVSTNRADNSYDDEAADVTMDSLQILLVEDNQINGEYGAHLLKCLGHQVRVVENGLECLVALKNSRFDLVLMDIQMPVMNGKQALSEIRRMEAEQGDGYRLPVIALTAHALRGDHEELLQQGFDGYISKPFRSADLIREMKMLAGL